MSSGPPPDYFGPGQVPAVVQQSTQVVQPAAPAPRVRPSGSWKGLQVTGYIQVVAGVVSVAFGIVAILLRAGVFYLGVPLWAGICFYIVAGILGIAAGGKQTKGLVLGYLTMSIIAALAASVMATLTGVVIPRDTSLCPDEYGSYRYIYMLIIRGRELCSTSTESRVAMDCLIIVLALAECVTAIVGASFTCSSLCCGQDPSYPMVYYESAPEVFEPGQPQGEVQFAYAPKQQFVQQPQFGNVPYHGQVTVPPMESQFQPAMQPQSPVLMPTQAPAQATAPQHFDGNRQPASN